MKFDAEALVGALRAVDGRQIKGVTISKLAVCGGPPGPGMLTDEEYAPYRAAADLKHDTYMRWNRTPMPPGALRNTVTVGGEIVAWLPYDGVPRVIEREFPDPFMNTVRDLAREHLGADEGVQQYLADRRADIEKMSAVAFPIIIGEFRGRSWEGAGINDWPAGMTFRQWQYANRRPHTSSDKQSVTWIYPPNPVRELTEAERWTWHEEANRYGKAFRKRFPQAHREWEFRNWWLCSREDRAAGPALNLRADERVLIEYEGEIQPAVVAWPMRKNSDGSENVDLAVEPDPRRHRDGRMGWFLAFPGRVLRYKDVPKNEREVWEDTWAELLKRVQQEYSEQEHARRYDK